MTVNDCELFTPSINTNLYSVSALPKVSVVLEPTEVAPAVVPIFTMLAFRFLLNIPYGVATNTCQWCSNLYAIFLNLNVTALKDMHYIGICIIIGYGNHSPYAVFKFRPISLRNVGTLGIKKSHVKLESTRHCVFFNNTTTSNFYFPCSLEVGI